MTASPDPHRLTLVVDDHPVVRRGLVALLTGESWAGEIREAATVGDALTIIHSASPTFAVVDLKLPDGSGTSVIKALTSYAPGCRSVVLTMDGDARLVRAALDAGATGYLLKDTPPEDLVAALRTVADGGVVLGEQLGVARTDRGMTGGPFRQLSPREVRIALLVATGATNSQIADRLGISDKTVRNQVSAITTKLDATGRVGIANLARENGLLT